jgi:hypothetical protein
LVECTLIDSAESIYLSKLVVRALRWSDD